MNNPINTNSLPVETFINMAYQNTDRKQGLNMKADVKSNLDAINNNMEKDLEEGNYANYELKEGSIKEEALCADFNIDFFEQIGLKIDMTNNKVTIDTYKYLNTDESSGNYLQMFTLPNQIKIISTYFKIETMRYANQKIYNKTIHHEKLLNNLYKAAIVLSFVVPYLPDLVGYTSDQFQAYSTYFVAASTIITFISYFFSRILMTTVANKTNFEQMQQALTKLRLTVETIIMGSYLVDNDVRTNGNTIPLQSKYKTKEELNNIDNGFNINLFMKQINVDLKDIYQ